jgi:hypothetical protein
MMVALDRPRYRDHPVAIRFNQKTEGIGIRLRGVPASGTRITGIAAAPQRVDWNRSARLRHTLAAMEIRESDERRCGQE